LDLTKLCLDAVGITEPNIQWTPQEAAQLCTATQALWPYSKEVHGNCIPDAHFYDPTLTQQGGIVQFLHGTHNGRIYQHSTDFLGRWATQILRLKEGRSLAIITAYHPCNASLATAGPGTIIMQQYQELRKCGDQAPNPRNQFLSDLTKHILQLRADGHNILLGMDANLERPDPQFAKFLDTFGLHDMLAEKYPDPTATHTKGNHLNLVLGDDFVSSNVEAIGILDSSHGSMSDHDCLYVDFNHDKQLAGPTAPSQRAFRIHGTVKVKKFRKKIRSSFDINPQLQALDEELTTATDPE
jgi:hypothetical protein